MDFAKRTIVVNGENVEFAVDEGGFPIADIGNDMDQVAARMAWWGSVLAAAEREAVEVDSWYRQWRAKLVVRALEADPKKAEWKIKSEIEASPKFLELKGAIAKAVENVSLAKSAFAAFDKKANVLQSKGARARSELAATGMTTPESPRPARASRSSSTEEEGVDDAKREERVAHVRETFKKKSKKKTSKKTTTKGS